MNEVNPGAQPQANAGAVPTMERTKFCKHCGQKIPEDAVICTQCGRQVEELRQAAPVQAQPQIIINNDNTNTNTNTNNNYGAVPRGREKNKWVALLLCLFLGGIGAHKFYEGKTRDLEKTALFQWMYAHCQEYGFILRYPADKESVTGVMYEPWHFRYVGKEAAAYIMENNLCLEEFLDLYK